MWDGLQPMAEYGKRAEDTTSSDNSAQGSTQTTSKITVPDSLVSEFLALHGVEASPPDKPSTTKNAFMGAVVGANPLVGGMLHVANNQLQGSAQSEWLSWKQWALAHPDWPEFWEPHKERITKEVLLMRETELRESQRGEIKYGYTDITSTRSSASKPLHQKPAGLVIAVLAGAPGGPFGLITSPLVLWLCSINGPKIIKQKSGKEQKIGVWAQWAGAGVIIAPMLAGLTALLNPSPAPKQAEQTTTTTTFQPGVPGRTTEEVCNTTSKACQQWTALAVG